MSDHWKQHGRGHARSMSKSYTSANKVYVEWPTTDSACCSQSQSEHFQAVLSLQSWLKVNDIMLQPRLGLGQGSGRLAMGKCFLDVAKDEIEWCCMKVTSVESVGPVLPVITDNSPRAPGAEKGPSLLL
jgi:hypothetical protein